MGKSDPLRKALEVSLTADPDDLATHAAYADYLVDQGDPRGEFVQVQLALEDPKRSAADRRKLRAREKKLFEQHKRDWLGDAAPLFFPDPDDDVEDLNDRFSMELYQLQGFECRFVRGWIDSLVLEEFGNEIVDALATSPAIRLLRQLTIVYSGYNDDGFKRLGRWPAMACLRRFQVGSSDKAAYVAAPKVCQAVSRMSRLEELYLYARAVPARKLFALELPHLRTLHLHHLYQYPLDVLARNPSLGNLAELSCWPHALYTDDEGAYIQAGPFRELCFSPHLKSLTHLALHLTDIGDEGAKAIVESGILERLRVLDLYNGRITDAGARILASSPDVRHLQRLRITNNNLTDAGLAALRATGVTVESQRQYDDDEIAEGMHLLEGDME